MPADVHGDCKKALHDAAALCRELGHEVVEVRPNHDAMPIAKAFLTVLSGNISKGVEEAEAKFGRKAKSSDLELGTRLLALLGKTFDAHAYTAGITYLQAEVRRLALHYEGYDAILTPTLSQPLVKVGALLPKGLDRLLQSLVVATRWKAPLRIDALIEDAASNVYSFVPFTPLANFTDHPSMSVPLYWNVQNLPVGVMFTGRFGDEKTLFGLAAQLEEARPWRNKRPTF